jgi:hypothetical protein
MVDQLRRADESHVVSSVWNIGILQERPACQY